MLKYFKDALGLKIILPPLFGLMLFTVFSGEPGDQWEVPSLEHPLGTDEFGRDVIATALAASGSSLIKGLIVTVVALAAPILGAELITLRHSALGSILVRVAASVIESIPVVLWVLIAIIALNGPRLVIIGIVFTLVVFPIATHVISGEFIRLRTALYVEASYLLGASEIRILSRYILPNAASVLAPFAVQVLGAAIAVDGAIGVIGLGNRSELDLGVFLLRGKENFLLHPQVLVVSLMMYAILYGYIIWAAAIARRVFVQVGSVSENTMGERIRL
jgi:ABC-type dipeptide/oligopeptide/nickel transport system permease subunit